VILLLLGAIHISGEPRVGETIAISVTNAARPRVGVPVHAVYQPGSPDQEQTAVGATDAAGETHWTPLHAGAAAIRAAGQQEVVLVAGGGARAWAGVALWFCAFVGFCGAAGWSVRRTAAR
jgi:hypothetical protein